MKHEKEMKSHKSALTGRRAAALSMAFAVLLGVGVFAGCSSKQPGKETTEAAGPVVKVTTETVRAADLQDTYQAPGTVRARNSATIASKVPGYIEQVKVKPGDAVRAGQTLIVLHAQDLDAQVASAKAAQQAAGSGIEEAQKARVAAESNAQLTEATYKRYKALLAKRSVSQQEFDEVDARYKAAAANLEMANAAIQRARSSAEQAQAQVKAAEVNRSYAVLGAPFSGVVTEKHADPGSLAMPGQPLLVVEQSGDYRLEATVEESHIAAVKIGEPVQVSVEALGPALQGRVNEIVPMVDAASRAFLVKIDLPRTSRADAIILRSGLFGRATFAAGSRQAITVPGAAVRKFGELTSVFVAENGVAHQRLVTLGAHSGDRVEVLSGLSEGDRVVVSPLADLRDGARVEEVRQ